MKKNLFNSVKLTKPRGSTFDLSHDVKQSMKFGQLYPTMSLHVVPGDKIRLGCDALIRFMPLVAPVMHRMDVTMHYFFVPYRLLWDNWENFITNTEVGGTVPVVPYFNLSPANVNVNGNKLVTYFGIPLPANAGGIGTEKITAWEFAAMRFVYNEFYRDQDLIDEINYKLSDGLNDFLDFDDLLFRSWEHDYFTSARPEAQKGDPVSVPITSGDDIPVLKSADPGPGVDSEWQDTDLERVYALRQVSSDIGIGQDQLYVDAAGYNLGTLVSDYRRAFALQRWLERNSVAGTRYIEFIRAHWGVNSSDSRLQRPEYIAGSKSPVNISEVLNTTGTEDLPQGNMAGHGVSVTNGGYGTKFIEEHGVIIGLASVMPKTAYMQGISRHFHKFNNSWEYFTPEMEHIGEQAIINKELFAWDGTNGEADFGYTPRYAEYKYMPNRVAGDMMDDLKFWHLAMDFPNQPGLSQDFINCNPRTDIFAITDGTDYLISHIYHKIRASRLMSYYSTPI